MNIQELIRPEWIRLELAAESREEVIRQLADSLEKDGVLTDPASYIETVLQREEQGSTAIGFDVAIPHGKSEAVQQPAVAFARLRRGIIWDREQEEIARFVFLIAVPEAQASDAHLQILADLSRRLMHASFREGLKQADSPEKVLEALKS